MCSHIQQEYDPSPCSYCAEDDRRSQEQRDYVKELVRLVEGYLPLMNKVDFLTYKVIVEKLVGRPRPEKGEHYKPNSAQWCSSLATGNCSTCGTVVPQA